MAKKNLQQQVRLVALFGSDCVTGFGKDFALVMNANPANPILPRSSRGGWAGSLQEAWESGMRLKPVHSTRRIGSEPSITGATFRVDPATSRVRRVYPRLAARVQAELALAG